MLRCLRSHDATRLLRPGQGCTLHAIVGNDVRHLIGRDKQVGPCPVRRTGFTHQMGEGLRTVWNDAGMFGEHRVTCRQVRGQHAHQLVIREVPRFHGHHHADGVMLYPGFAHLRWVFHRGEKLFGVIRIVASDLRAEFNLAAALGNQFTHLHAGDFSQLFGTGINQICQLVQHRQAFVDATLRPVGVVERIGGAQRRLDISIGMRRVFFDEFVVGRIHCLIGHCCLLFYRVGY